MPATPPPSLDALAKYPKMTAWFNPKLLAKLLWRVIVSDLFGQYADRRLIVAALDTVSSKELVKRAKQFAPGEDNEERWTLSLHFSHQLGASGLRISESRCAAATLAIEGRSPDVDGV